MRWLWIALALGFSSVARGDVTPSVSLPVLTDEPAGTEPLAQKDPPKLAEIPATVAPAEFTDDPVLGRAERIVGYGVPNKIAFTFDDGPSMFTTPQVLAALAKYDVPASFFVVTRKFGRGLVSPSSLIERALLAKEAQDGHLVGSHAIHHIHLQDVPNRVIDSEINGSLQQLALYLGKPVALFRPPFGKINWAGRKRLKGLGVTEVFWSIDPRDWDAVAGDEDELRRRIGHDIWNSGGGVIILHDSKAVTANVIAGVLDDLEAANCHRLAVHKPPMLPVSLHYFMQDADAQRTVPADVAARTNSYAAALPDRCSARRKKRR